MAHARLNLAKQDLEQAAQRIQQAANLAPTALPSSDPEWQHIVALRAEIELAQHNYAAAAADAQIALERAKIEAVDPKSSAWVGEALVLRARSELAQGDKVAAATSAREALPHVEQNLDPSHPLIAAARRLSSGT
jgi:tetratricopeptide (TPR) repeat protein